MNDRRFLLCRADFVLPLAPPDRGRVIDDGYVLSEGATLLEVGRFTPETGRRLRETLGAELCVVGEGCGRTAPDEVARLTGAVLPAFVKAHGHDHEQALIGIAKDRPLTWWLDHAVNPFTRYLAKHEAELTESLLDPPYTVIFRAARLNDIHYGITASLVHHCNWAKYRAEELARVNEAAGTTMVIAIGSQDRHYLPELLDRPEDALGRLDRVLALTGLERTSFCPGPDQLFSNSRAVLVPSKRWAREHGTLFHTHSSEEPATTRWFTEAIEPGLSEVEYADSIGILDERTMLAHQVNCGERDVEILAARNVAVVHNPLANTILGSGMPPLLDLLRAGVRVAISTDGSGSADNQNMLAAARLAAQYQRARHQDATLLPALELLEMVTSAPARMLGLDQGELAPGKAADWILVDLGHPNLVPTRADNLVANLIWAADGSEVDTVVARGRVLKRDGRVLPFSDGSDPLVIMTGVQTLSELFVAHQATAPELRGTGVHR
jgi:5-methylthioadenosine/S-adenosylhomocysteine deaminase